MSVTIDVHLKCYDAIYDYDYYVDLFNQWVDKTGGVDHARGLTTPDDIIEFWDGFWYALPDVSAIQREPFNLICDICESGGNYE